VTDQPLHDKIDEVIHQRVRLGIVSSLAPVEALEFNALKGLLGLTDGNLSTHARVLEEAGYLAVEKQFKGRKPLTIYRLTPQGRTAFAAYVEYLGQMLGPEVSAAARPDTPVPQRVDIAGVAEPLLRQLAEKTGGTVTVVTILDGRRVVHCEVKVGPGQRINGEVSGRGGVYLSATVRLLLAYESVKEVRQFVKENGRPSAENWPQATTNESFGAALEKMKAQGAALTQPGSGVASLSLPLREGEKVVAALGLHLPAAALTAERREAVVGEMKKTAAEISKKLTERTGKK
jgi:DNA-binding IclR family transcriptional regulator/DNA-binding HxlR family transcriptional regulator